MESTMKRGGFTFRTAAVFFVLSAFVDVIFIDSRVQLLGNIYGGVVAVMYHLIYVVLFLMLGVGLWNAKPWGYTALLVITLVYTVDTVQAFFSRGAVEADLIKQLSEHEEIFRQAGIDKEYFLNVFTNNFNNMMTVVPFLVLACWWGFVWYAYIRRDYFQAVKK